MTQSTLRNSVLPLTVKLSNDNQAFALGLRLKCVVPSPSHLVSTTEYIPCNY
jgi:hypothetical protein